MRARVFMGIAVMLAAAGVLAPAAPASAIVPGLVEQQLTSNFDSIQSKTVTVTCPAGTTVVGGGADIFGGDGRVAVEQMLPDLTARTWQVTAKEVDAYMPDWEVTAHALCAPAPAGLVRVHTWTAATPNDKNRTANCPGNKTVLAAGYDITNGWGEVLVNQVVPNGGPGVAATSVQAFAYEEDAYNASWELHVYLLCADPVAGQEVVISSTASDPNEPKAINATCAAGQDATGGAVQVSTAVAGLESELAVDSIFPMSLSGATASDTMQGIAYEADNFGTNWGLTTYAFCT